MTDLMGLYPLAKEQGMAVDCFQRGARESISIQDGEERFIALAPFRLSSSQNEKQPLAHEWGHCMTGSFYNRHSGLDVRQKHKNSAGNRAIEKRIGEEALNAAASAGSTEVWQLADYFNVSEGLMKKSVPCKVRPHQFRHSDCSSLYRAGIKNRTVPFGPLYRPDDGKFITFTWKRKTLPGHSSIEITANAYAHLAKGDTAASVIQLER